jgi:benzoate membrane transport protein
MTAALKDFSLSAAVAGLIAVIISYAGPLTIVFQAASAAHLPPAILSSWILAISVGSGLACIFLSAWLRVPVMVAWSIPGSALLVSMLPLFPFDEVVGAYIVGSLIVLVVGLSGAFDGVIRLLPKAIAGAMLAGILLRFGIDVFVSLKSQPGMVAAMFAAYLVLRRIKPRYAIVAVLTVGFAYALASRQVNGEGIVFGLATPVFTAPAWNWRALVNIGIPLAVVTLAGQNLPGMAVLRAAGYDTPAKPLISAIGVVSVLASPFASHGLNLAAVTAAICAGPEAHEDKGRRYVAGIAAGFFFLVMGIFGTTLASLFAALPREMIAALAGMALFGPIIAGLSGAMETDSERDGALVTFLFTASGVTLLGLASVFWGLLAGIVVHLVMTARRRRSS